MKIISSFSCSSALLSTLSSKTTRCDFFAYWDPYIFLQELRRYYDLTVFPALTKTNFKDRATLEGFKHAYALVSSRAFIVDAYHGLAMVPIADA